MDSSSEGEDSENEFIDNLRAPKARVFLDRINYLETLDNDEFHKRFRINKDTFQFLCDEIRHLISPFTDRKAQIDFNIWK